MLWTVMPLEAVMDGSDSYEPEYFEVSWKDGGRLIVEKLSMDSARVVRLISGNANDYLDASIQPGTIIQYAPKNQANIE